MPKEHLPTRADLMAAAMRKRHEDTSANADNQLTTSSDTSLNAESDIAAPSRRTRPKLRAPSRKLNRKPGGGASSSTDKPMGIAERIAIETLRCFERFRIVRTLDIATNCFADRPYTAAQKAARRAVKLLLKRGAIRKFLSEHHQTFYALASTGAAYLRSTGLQATSSLGRATTLTNPTHTLWINFVTLSFEARGVRYSDINGHFHLINLSKGVKT